MWSLEKIKNSIDKNEINRIVELEGKSMISGNLLEALYELNILFVDSEIEISSFWSPFVSRPDVADSVKLNQDYLPAIETIIGKIKPADQGFESDFIGKISSTKADPDANSRLEGEIILNYIVGDEDKVSKAKVILSKQDYDKACEAHKNGKSVKVIGKLITNGRSKTIEKPKFEVIP